MTEIEDLARFYGELYRALKKEKFTKQEALRIILKEAKIPRKKSTKKDKSMEEMLEDALKKLNTS
jgi:hypothetical protein